MNMFSKINAYFYDKKINANVIDTIETNDYITFKISLNDITKRNKFNNKMEQELSYVLGTNVLLKVNDEIYITISKHKQMFDAPKGINVNVGCDTLGNVVNIDFTSNPHWLIGGSTGSGKSVFLNNVIKELVHKYYNAIQFAFIDLKKVEFYKYNKLKYNITDVANNISDANNILDGLIDIMNKRYEMYQNVGVLDIKDYNKLMDERGISYCKNRYTILVIDELAELMLLDKENIQDKLQRLLQLGRASGIYVLSATQRPSADVLSGTLKVNYTTRICFKVSSIYDSKIIINKKGGEQLFGNGDGLILKNGQTDVIRFQATPPTSDDVLLEYQK